MLFDTRDDMVRTLNLWASQTFGDALANVRVTPENTEAVELAKYVLDRQRLFDKAMDGTCSQNLLKDEFEAMGINYVELFNKLQETDAFWTPFDIVYSLCEHMIAKKKMYDAKAKTHRLTFERIAVLMSGRALRALPSFIREYQLRNALQRTFPKAELMMDEELDRKYHCDIKMVLNQKTFFFWSFVSSQRGICKFADKFRDNRYGIVMDGVHVLCPFDRFSDKNSVYRGWQLYSNEYMDDIRAAIFQRQYFEYADVCARSERDVAFYQKPSAVIKSSPIQAV